MRISPGPTRWPPRAERRLVPAKSNLKPQTTGPHSPDNATTPAPACTGHQGRRAHTPGARTRTLVVTTRRTQHPTPALEAQGPPPSPTALSSASDSTTSTTTTTSSTTTTTSSSSTPAPKPRGKPPKQAPKLVFTASNPAAAKAHALTTPAPATRPKPKTAAKQPPKPLGVPRPHSATRPKPKPKPGARTAARAPPPKDVLYDIRPQQAKARRQQRPARSPPHRHRRRRHHLHGRARRGRSTTHLVSPPLKACTLAPWTAPDRTRSTRGSTSSVLAPLPTLDVSPHTAHAPLPPPPRVETRPRGGGRARIPGSPHPPAPRLPAHPHGTGLRGIPQARHRHQSPRPDPPPLRPLLRPRRRPRPGTVVAALDPHAALEGLVHQPRRGSVENCRLQPAGGLGWVGLDSPDLKNATHPSR